MAASGIPPPAAASPSVSSQAHLPPLPQLQVLRDVLLPADAGHGGRLWWEGGSTEDTEGHPRDDPYRPLLLLLPLLPPNQDHQVRRGRVCLEEQIGLFCTLSRASAGSLSPASSLLGFGLNKTKPVMKGWASHSQDPHTGHPHRGRRNRGMRTPEFPSLTLTVPYKLYHREQIGLFTFPFHPFQLMRLGSILR